MYLEPNNLRYNIVDVEISFFFFCKTYKACYSWPSMMQTVRVYG